MAPGTSVALAARQKLLQQFISAAETGDLELFKKIAARLDCGKGLAWTVAGIKDANKRGALHIAAGEGHTEVCKYIVSELKLNVDAKDGDGETPLLHAARQGHFSTAKYLIDSGANLAAPDDMGYTPLHYAARIGNIELMRLLLSKGLNVNLQTAVGTPLMWAASHDQTDAVKLLLEHNADPNIMTEDYVNALSISTTAGSLQSLELLIQAGGKVNITANGTTPLHIAAHQGNPGIINCLLKAGADPNGLEENGYKPVQVAATRGHRSAVEILFPLTLQISSLPKWTVEEIINCMQSGIGRQQEKNHKVTVQRDVNAPKTDAPEVSPEAKEKAAEAKARGLDAFKQKDYMAAIDAYTKASDFDPTDATLVSNRSLCWLLLGKAEPALIDAKACKALSPDWPKACYREGAALRLLLKFDKAAYAFFEGMMLASDNKELVDAFREAIFAGKMFMLGDYFEDLGKRIKPHCR